MQKYTAPESEPERSRWFAHLAPDVSSLDLESLRTGLGRPNEVIFWTAQEFIFSAFEKHHVDSIATPPGGPEYQAAVAEASAHLLSVWKGVPKTWVDVWCEALILDLWQEHAENKQNVRKGKKSWWSKGTEPEGDSPTLGKEVLRFSQQSPPIKKPSRLPIDQVTFALYVNASDKSSPKVHNPEVLDIASVRCLSEGQDPNQVENYQLSLFIHEFDELLNSVKGNKAYNLKHGKLAYLQGGSGGGGKAVRHIISTQQEFEVALSSLLNNTDDNSLSFTFFPETNAERRQRVEAENRADKSAKLLELDRIKQRQDNLKARERRGAIAPAKATKTTQAEATKNTGASSTAPPVPAKSALRNTGYKPLTRRQPLPASAATLFPDDPSASVKESDQAQAAVPKGGFRPTPLTRRKPLDASVATPFPDDPIPKRTIPAHAPAAKGRSRPSTRTIPQDPVTPGRTKPLKKPAKPKSGEWNGSDGTDPTSTSTRPGLRRKKAVDLGVAVIQYAARKSSQSSGNPLEPKNVGEQSAPNQKRPDLLESETLKEVERKRGTRRPSNFQPQTQSPAIKRASTATSRASRVSISLPNGIKNLFKRGGKDTAPAIAETGLDGLSFEQLGFYEEVSRKTFRRGGGFEQDISIEEVKEVRQVELHETIVEDNEIEEPDEADDFENPDEYLVSRLQNLQNMEELSQIRPVVDSPRWLECCAMFQINPYETGLNKIVTLAGLKTPLYQYQAYAVYWQMKTSRTVGGGFVADEMGLGKTLSFLAYLIAERQLSWLWEDVEAARRDHARRHLNEIEQSEHDKCPSQHERPNWIACPCASSSPTSKFPPKAGVRLACVPASLVKSWREQWNTHLDEGEMHLAMRLVIAHDASNPVPAPSFDNRDARHARNIKELGAVKHPFDAKQGKFYDDIPRFHQDRYLVLTTRDSYKLWVKKFEYKGQVLTYTKGDKPTWVNGKNRGIVFGIAMIDECHEEYFKEKGRSGVLSDLPTTNSPFIWGYSGTPLINTPRSLEGVLWAIEQHYPKKNEAFKESGWDQDEHLRQYNYRALELVCKEFEKYVKSRTGSPEIFKRLENDFRPFLTQFMIRRTADSTWFGRPLIKLKIHIHQDIILAHNRRFDHKLAELEEVVKEETYHKLQELQQTWKIDDPNHESSRLPMKLAFNTQCRVEWRLRIIATFPFLLNLVSEDHKHHLNLTTEEIIKYKGTEVFKSPYSLYLKQIVQSSPKCIWLGRYIRELSETLDVDGKEQKLVIMTQFNPVALILKLFIERLLKDKKGRVGLVCAGMKQRERTAVIDVFTDAIDKDPGMRKTKQDFQILVGTTRLIGTGLQLTRACNLVMMEPDYEFYRELQAISRVHRIGQKNPRSYSFRLIDQGSEIENRIIKRQEERGELFGREIKTQLLEDVFPSSEEVAGPSNESGLLPRDESGDGPTQGEWEELVDIISQFPKPPGIASQETVATSKFFEHLIDGESGPEDNGPSQQ